METSKLYSDLPEGASLPLLNVYSGDELQYSLSFPAVQDESDYIKSLNMSMTLLVNDKRADGCSLFFTAENSKTWCIKAFEGEISTQEPVNGGYEKHRADHVDGFTADTLIAYLSSNPSFDGMVPVILEVLEEKGFKIYHA